MNMRQLKLVWVAIRAAIAALFGDISDLFSGDTSRDYGMMRYADPGASPGPIKIVVVSENDKAQVLAFSKYIHDLNEIDTDYRIVNIFAHLHRNPDLVEVQDG